MRGCTTTVWWHGGCLLFTVPFVPLFPFSPSFCVPSCPSSFLRSFVPSSLHPFVPPSFDPLNTAVAACWCCLLFNGHRFVQANNRLFATSVGKATTTAGWIGSEKKKDNQTERTRTLFQHTYFDLDLPVQVISVFQRHRFGRRQWEIGAKWWPLLFVGHRQQKLWTF